MGAFSIWHWIIVLIIVLLLFGKGKIPTLMGDMAKGIKSFKKNMSDEVVESMYTQCVKEHIDEDILELSEKNSQETMRKLAFQ